MYQGTKVPPHRYLQYMNMDLYEIHIASNYIRLAMGFISAGDIFMMSYADAADYMKECRRCTKDTLIHRHMSEELAQKMKEFLSTCT